MPFTLKLNVHTQSDDESEGEGSGPGLPKTTRRLYPIWRSRIFSLFLWSLDAVASEQEASAVEASATMRKGNIFRCRGGPAVVKHSRAPVGLPINCYNQQFLQTLKPWELALLDPQEPYEFNTNGLLKLGYTFLAASNDNQFPMKTAFGELQDAEQIPDGL